MALVFTGAFHAGDVLTIDMENMSIKHNGTLVYTFSGDFFAFLVGTNGFVYTDGESSRSVAVSVVHKDRWA
jgi:phage-related protein